MKTFFPIQDSDSSLFDSLLKQCVIASKELERYDNILIVSHLDADGLSSCALTRIALQRRKINHDWIVVQGIDENIFDYINKYDLIIFTDIGSSQLSMLSTIKDKKIIILDHHEPDEKEDYENIIHINSHNAGVSNSRSISGAGMTYIFSLAMDSNNRDLAYIGIIGAIGDVQEENGFIGINSIIFEDALRSGKIKAKKGLKLFGAQSKSLVRLIAYNNDLGLKGINGSIPRAKEFLEELEINMYNQRGEIKYIDLSEEQKEKLDDAIRDYRKDIPNLPSIEGYNYTLTEEKEGSMFKDAREYATFLNACGRMERSDIGIGSLMNDYNSKRNALNVLKQYKSEIGIALNWINEQFENKEKMTIEDNFIIIDARGIIRASIIGTIASIISRMEKIREKTLILTLASLDNGDIKASLRRKGNEGSDLNNIISRIAKQSGSYSGGHENASGATIPKDNYEEFISIAKNIMREKSFKN